MSEIPADILKAAEDALDNALCHDVEAYGGSYEDSRNAAIKDIATVILAERVNERVRMGMHVERMVREAVEAERERCARVAKKWKGHPADFHFAGRQIATAIQEPQI